MSPGNKVKLVGLILHALLALTPCAAWAVPLPLQGAILVKALKYDQTFQAKGERPIIAILSGNAETKQAAQLASVLRKFKVEAKVVSRGRVSETLKEASALYAFPGQINKEILDLCRQWKVLTLSGDVTEVEAGRASMSVGVHDGKPQLVINLRRVTVEGHRLSSRLLKLARIIE